VSLRDLTNLRGGIDQAPVGGQPGQCDQPHVVVNHLRQCLRIDCTVGVTGNDVQTCPGLHRFSDARQIAGPLMAPDQNPLTRLPGPQCIECLTPCCRAAAGEGDALGFGIQHLRGCGARPLLNLQIGGLHRPAQCFALQLVDYRIEGGLTWQ
jgi:hypothetical protein